MVATHKGFLVPLCESCQTEDCENLIETRKISILGVNKDIKFLVKGNDVYIVISCEGYTNKQE